MDPDAPPTRAPMLAGATHLTGPPDAYQYEPKMDGQRIIARLHRGDVRLAARSGSDATASYPELASMPTERSAVLDGEIVAFDEAGRPEFEALQARMHVRRPGPKLLAKVPVVYVVFDVLWVEGELLIDRPQHERRTRLEQLALAGPAWQTGGVLKGGPEELVDAARAVGLEGVLAKRLDAPYLPGERSPAWVKLKAFRQREFVVGGWVPGRGRRDGDVGSLAIGYVDGAVSAQDRLALRYVGQVGSGLSEATLGQLRVAFSRYAADESPFTNPTPVPGLRWVEPVLVVQVAFTERTRSGTLRHPRLKGLRPDLDPAEVGYDDELAIRDHRTEP